MIATSYLRPAGAMRPEGDKGLRCDVLALTGPTDIPWAPTPGRSEPPVTGEYRGTSYL
jgi:hypothetical protein